MPASLFRSTGYLSTSPKNGDRSPGKTIVLLAFWCLTTVLKRIQIRVQTMQESSNSFFTWTAAAGAAFYCARSALQIATRPAPFLPALNGGVSRSK